MKLDIISDIHLTHFRDHGGDWIASWVPEGEILVLAGDVGEFHWWQLQVQKVKALAKKYQQILFVAGNHDYYGTTFTEGDARFREIANQIENFHFLERDVLELEGIKFAGCTLWFPWDELNHRYERFLNDFALIQEFKPGVYGRNVESRHFLKFEVPKDTDVVITHHLPSALSIHPKYANDPVNCFYVCEVDEVIQELQPRVWVSGHTHYPFDYMLGSTRMIVNPMGYPRERNFGPEGYRPVTIEL